jgi:hypothetical protein
MKFPSFNEWLLVREGKGNKSLEDRQAYNDFISGKSDKIKLQAGGPVARGHQAHASGTGIHDSRPRKQRTRGGQNRAWKKDLE